MPKLIDKILVQYERFASRAWLAQESAILKWAGQFRQAAERDAELEPLAADVKEIHAKG
jgi:hypothetical protein